MKMNEDIKTWAMAVKGFLSEAEGLTLFELARQNSLHGPCLEIGSYCGKSTIFLAEGCRVSGQHPLIAVDHHRGSEEQQVSQLYFDPDLYNAEEGIVNTLDVFMHNIRKAGLSDWVIPVIADSHRFGRYWTGANLSLLFIDGSHAEKSVFQDFYTWSPKVRSGGYLCIHDIYTDPTAGGQAPYRVLEHARATGLWKLLNQVETLGILQRR